MVIAKMEVGAPHGCAPCSGVRIKLLFEDQHILSPHQLADGLSACWFVVRPHLQRIADLAFDIACSFQLSKTCPHGISLRMENFTLPPPQPTWLLKDNDTVSVNKKEGHVMLALPDVKLANSLSLDDSDTVDKHGPIGVNLRAVEEFEKETGGYQSEEEEDAWEAVDEHLDVLPQATGTATGNVKKKRKRGGEEGVDKQVQCCKQRTEGDMKKKDKRGKKRNFTMQQEILQEDKIPKGQKFKNDTQIGSFKLAEETGKNNRSSQRENRKNEASIEVNPTKKNDGTRQCRVDEQVQCCKQRTEGDMREKESEDKVLQEDKLSKGQKFKNDTQIVSLKLADETGKNNRSSQRETRKNEASNEVHPNKKNDGTRQRRQEIPCLSTSSQDKKLMDLEKDIVMEAGVETIKKPSRSTLRKKAKRLWKRQHSEAPATERNEKPGDCNEDSKLHAVVQVHVAFPDKNKDDGEAEEENLPVLVRPGHVRFEPLDEDEDNCHVQHSAPMLSWHDGVSKRQGQSWGQEKGKGRRGGKKYREIVPAETSEFGEIVFEALPSLETAPQVNDVLAYRLVELTSSMCPEVSEYRVGKVAEFEGQSGMLKLVPLPSYPLKHSLEDVEQETCPDTSFFSFPYNEDGSLETTLVSLVDIRLVEGSSNDKQRYQDTQVETSNVLTQTDNHVTQSAEAMAQSPNCKAEDDQDALGPSSKIVSSKELTNHSSTVEGTVACHSDEGITSTWQELSEVLDKKKEELSRLEGIASFSEPNGNTKSDQVEKGTINVFSGKNVHKEGGPQHRSWSFRSKRTGALGPTMALLRTQNIL